MSAELRRIVDLSHRLGDPARDLAILAEGNTSMRTGSDRMLVKASGASLATVVAEDFVDVAISRLLELVDDPAAGDAEVAATFADIEATCGRRPSVEAMLHAVCLASGGAEVVGHTHPVPVLALLCSVHAEALATHLLFPDQVVVLGSRPLYLPYVDPGLALARRVRGALAAHGATRVIYLGNHGMFALGASPEHVMQITDMAVKAARVLAGGLACGGVLPLAPAEVTRIDSRPDEQYRRLVLARAVEGADG